MSEATDRLAAASKNIRDTVSNVANELSSRANSKDDIGVIQSSLKESADQLRSLGAQISILDAAIAAAAGTATASQRPATMLPPEQ